MTLSHTEGARLNGNAFVALPDDHTKVVELLLENGAKVIGVDGEALRTASARGHIEVHAQAQIRKQRTADAVP
ncbi:MAG: hypothetical protein L6R35_007249, partial [Caloplaca aegaea]